MDIKLMMLVEICGYVCDKTGMCIRKYEET